jgi:cell division transport system permease protein
MTSLRGILARARRGFREEIRLYAVAVTSLAVAFLCLAAALLALQNLGAIADRWGESGHITVYLRDGITQSEVTRLSAVLEGLREVDHVRAISSAEAREEFLARSELGGDLTELPVDAFPASIEVGLVSGVPIDAIEKLAKRVGALEGVSDVESHRGWFERLSALLTAGKIGSIVVAALVGFCVFAVVGNTVRLSVARRRREIEVMKLCGATNAFVRGPFIVEGVVQSLSASLLAILVLTVAFFALRSDVDAALAMFLGTKAVFLGPGLLALVVLSGVFLGATSSALSLRRYLEV